MPAEAPEVGTVDSGAISLLNIGSSSSRLSVASSFTASSIVEIVARREQEMKSNASTSPSLSGCCRHLRPPGLNFLELSFGQKEE